MQSQHIRRLLILGLFEEVCQLFMRRRTDCVGLCRNPVLSQVTFTQLQSSFSLFLQPPLDYDVYSDFLKHIQSPQFVSTVSSNSSCKQACRPRHEYQYQCHLSIETNHCRKYLASLNNCKMLADAHVADSAVPIWTASSVWDNSRKSCSI